MNFSRDFFSRNIPGWEKHLAQFRGRRVRALELGSFEGQSAAWLLENILSPDSSLVCVDRTVSPTLIKNLSGWSGRVQIVEMDATGFASLTACEYDIIYVDAHHVARDVILQAGLLWPNLMPGGVMIFDDYGHGQWTVKPAVDFFIEHWEGVKILHRGWQAYLQKPTAQA